MVIGKFMNYQDTKQDWLPSLLLETYLNRLSDIPCTCHIKSNYFNDILLKTTFKTGLLLTNLISNERMYTTIQHI